jgi:hypothetical protein
VGRRLGELVGTKFQNDPHRAKRHEDDGRRGSQLDREPMRTDRRTTIDLLDDPRVQGGGDPHLTPKDGSIVTKARLQLRVFGDHASTPRAGTADAIERRSFASAR